MRFHLHGAERLLKACTATTKAECALCLTQPFVCNRSTKVEGDVTKPTTGFRWLFVQWQWKGKGEICQQPQSIQVTCNPVEQRLGIHTATISRSGLLAVADVSDFARSTLSLSLPVNIIGEPGHFAIRSSRVAGRYLAPAAMTE